MASQKHVESAPIDLDPHWKRQESVGSSIRQESEPEPPVSFDDRPTDQESESRVRQSNLRLYNAATKGDFESARTLVGDDINLWTARITDVGDNVLLIATRAGQWQFIQKLVEILPPEALAMQDSTGTTALHRVATRGNIKTAKLLISKNNDLTNIRDKRGFTSLLSSVQRPSLKEMVWHLTLVTKPKHPSPDCPFTGDMAGKFLRLLTAGGYNDVTLYLVRRHPCLALRHFPGGQNLLRYLSAYPAQFLSGSKLSFWERFIYKFVPAETEYANTGGPDETHTSVQSLRRFIFQVLGVEKVREAKLQHVCALELVKNVFEQLESKMNNREARIYLKDALYAATSSGNVEIVKTCLEKYPSSISFPISDYERKMLYVAVECRQLGIFNLISMMPTFTPALGSYKVESGNTLWHLSAKLAPASQLLSVSGAALQMQWEMQWFKEVEKLVRPADKNKRNAFGKTAEEVFREEHNELAEKAEKWMKDTANSCMIVVTLIATVMFAAAFTVPGGNISEEGIPIFLEKNVFMVFAISDALSLFSSSTSLLMFLAILTARYEPQDFLLALPKRLIIGLGSLFFSIITMMVAFGATLYIVLGERWQWIYIPIILLASIPVIAFGMLQLPLFIEIVQSTYGSGLFVKTYW